MAPSARPVPALLAGAESLSPVPECFASGAEYDSRQVKPGDLFFAFAGSKTDGARFASQAAGLGAVAVVSEAAEPAGFPLPWIRVAHGRRALALAARRLYPVAAAITLLGVTGTNGKSTIVALLGAILRAGGRIPALIGTISYDLAGEVRPSINTTPESLDLYRLLDEAAARGATHGALEVSSHALALGRVWAMDFDTAIFTNLTQDHLDFHPSMDAYFAAKSLLFSGQGAPAPRHAVINAGDPWAEKLPLTSETEVTRYGLDTTADIRAENVRAGLDGLRFEIRARDGRWPVATPLAGMFNVSNILAAFGAARAHGIDPETAIAGIEGVRAVPGRFERVDMGQPFLVAVDYAHTSDALRNAITAARALTRKRVITVFGCGGDRDRSKRPLMGQTAGELSDFAVLTSDNPRSEDPLMILNDALVGLRRTETAHTIDPDRASAIRTAIAEARPGDAVLIAGKGHETYQVLKDRTIHFDDREVAREVLRSFGFPGREI